MLNILQHIYKIEHRVYENDLSEAHLMTRKFCVAYVKGNAGLKPYVIDS